MARGADSLRSAGLNLPAEPSVLWTGTASTEGRFGDAGSESLYVRAERGLSYIQLGADEVDFAGSFSNYTRSHYGLHYFWTDLPQLTVRAFRAYEASRAVEEELAGDGTRYYRLRYEHIEPYSEDVTLVRREWLYPHRIVSEQRVDRDAYRIDYRTGQIFLTEPLAIVDADGYLLSIRVRYQTVGEEEQQLVQGVQSYVTHPLANLRGTFWQVDGPPQSKKNVLVLGVDSELFDTEIDFEIARSVTASNVGRAYLLQLTRRNLADWNVRFSHQNVEPAFQTVQARIDSGMVTTLRGERPFGSGRKLSVSLAREQASPASSATFSAELGSQLAWRSVRPGLLLRGTWGRGIHGSMSVEGSVASEFQAGRVELKSEHALVGSYFTKQAASVEYAILPALSTTLDLAREKTAHEAPARYRMTWGLAHTLTLNGADVQLKGGYELGPSASGTAGAVLYGAATKWHVTDEHTVEAGIEQRRPVNGAGSDALGTTLGWTTERRSVKAGLQSTGRQVQLGRSMHCSGRAVSTSPTGPACGVRRFGQATTGGMRTRVSVSGLPPSLIGTPRHLDG